MNESTANESDKEASCFCLAAVPVHTADLVSLPDQITIKKPSQLLIYISQHAVHQLLKFSLKERKKKRKRKRSPQCYCGISCFPELYPWQHTHTRLDWGQARWDCGMQTSPRNCFDLQEVQVTKAPYFTCVSILFPGGLPVTNGKRVRLTQKCDEDILARGFFICKSLPIHSLFPS